MSPLYGFHLRFEVTPFVILFIERDGSTYLTSLLMSHPDIDAAYEKFAVLKQKGLDGKAQLEWARNFLTPPLVSRAAAVGFKTKLVDILYPDEFAQLLIEKQCRIIQMMRRNHVKAVISRINARRLYEAVGTWNLYDENDRRPPMDVDPEEFDFFLRERKLAEDELDDYVAQLSLPTLKILYEELLIEKDQTIRRICDFLGARVLPLEARSIKHTSDNLRDVVMNFDSLKHNYTGTEYEEMFEQDLIST